jgi:hypothetical protein
MPGGLLLNDLLSPDPSHPNGVSAHSQTSGGFLWPLVLWRDPIVATTSTLFSESDLGWIEASPWQILPRTSRRHHRSLGPPPQRSTSEERKFVFNRDFVPRLDYSFRPLNPTFPLESRQLTVKRHTTCITEINDFCCRTL